MNAFELARFLFEANRDFADVLAARLFTTCEPDTGRTRTWRGPWRASWRRRQPPLRTAGGSGVRRRRAGRRLPARPSCRRPGKRAYRFPFEQHRRNISIGFALRFAPVIGRCSPSCVSHHQDGSPGALSRTRAPCGGVRELDQIFCERLPESCGRARRLHFAEPLSLIHI